MREIKNSVEVANNSSETTQEKQGLEFDLVYYGKTPTVVFYLNDFVVNGNTTQEIINCIQNSWELFIKYSFRAYFGRNFNIKKDGFQLNLDRVSDAKRFVGLNYMATPEILEINDSMKHYFERDLVMEEKVSKEIFEAAKELYEKLHSLDGYGDNFDRWEYDFESLEDYLRATIKGEVFTIFYDGNQPYEFAFTYSNGGWYMGVNKEKWYYYEKKDEIKEIMDAIREKAL